MAGIQGIVINDKSDINAITTNLTDNVDHPIIMASCPTSKGTEKWITLKSTKDYISNFGDPSFSKYGQASIQAYNALDAGAFVRFKRVVANDSTLANIGVVADIKNVKKQKTDANGVPIYIDKDTGKETTDPTGNSPVLKNHVEITYKLVSVILDGNDMNNFGSALLSDFKHTNEIGEDGHYPLFLIGDSGRGKSNKRFRIYINNSGSYPIAYARYIIEVIENDEVLEKINFTMDPNIIEKDFNQSLQNIVKAKSSQIRAISFDDEIEAFAKNVGFLIGQEDSFIDTDILFGTDAYGQPYEDITITNEVDLSTINGIQLLNGNNGAFGDTPILSENYPVQQKKVFDGSLPYDGDDIYDIDNNRIDAIFDANYPAIVKRAIEELVNFRQDCMYFRDMGLGISSIEEVKVRDLDNDHSMFSATYMNSYDIYDPFTRKPISVTIMYDLVRLFTKHFINGRTRPFCGLKYEIIIPSTSIIEGTLNFSPKNTPSLNQKTELDTLRINYLAYYNNVLTLDTSYTSQTKKTQLSWVCNILAIQEVIKAIRDTCPKIRYTFIDGSSEEFVKYKEDVKNEVIDKYAANFLDIGIQFVNDDQYTLNKIIYAEIYVMFKNWVENEFFTITAINSLEQ